MLIKLETPQVSATAAEALRYKKLEEKLALFGKITLPDVDRDGSSLDPTFSSSVVSSSRSCWFCFAKLKFSPAMMRERTAGTPFLLITGVVRPDESRARQWMEDRPLIVVSEV